MAEANPEVPDGYLSGDASDYEYNPNGPRPLREDRSYRNFQLALKDLRKRRALINAHYSYLVVHREVINTTASEIAEAEAIWADVSIRFYCMLATLRALGHFPAEEQELARQEVVRARTTMDKIETIMREAWLLEGGIPRRSFRHAATQIDPDMLANEVDRDTPALREIENVCTQTTPDLSHVCTQTPPLVYAREVIGVGFSPGSTTSWSVMTPAAAETAELATPPYNGSDDLSYQLHQGSSSPAGNPRRATSVATSTDEDVLEVHPRGEGFDEHRLSPLLEEKWPKVQTSEYRPGPPRSEVHVVPRREELTSVRYTFEETQVMLASWERFKEQYVMIHVDLWTSSEPWRQYYYFVVGKWSSRRPAQNMKASRCRYCFVYARPCEHPLPRCPYFKGDRGDGPTNSPERIAWVEVLQVCHNCLGPLHAPEECPLASDCKCSSRICRCERIHKHHRMLCGREGETLPSGPPQADAKSASARPTGAKPKAPRGKSDPRPYPEGEAGGFSSTTGYPWPSGPPAGEECSFFRETGPRSRDSRDSGQNQERKRERSPPARAAEWEQPAANRRRDPNPFSVRHEWIDGVEVPFQDLQPQERPQPPRGRGRGWTRTSSEWREFNYDSHRK